MPDFTGYPARQAIHFPFDLKSAVINSDTAVEEVAGAGRPGSYVLGDAYPNPFNPESTIRFSLPREEHVTLQVFSLAGQLVKTLHEGYVESGVYESVWDGMNEAGESVASGVYLYNLQAGSFQQTKKLTLLK